MFLFLLFSPSRGKNLLTYTPLCLWTKPRDTSSFSKNLRRTSVSSRVMTKSPSNLTGKVLCSLLLATVSCPPPKANYSFYVSYLSFVTMYHAKLPGHLDSTAGVCPEVQGALIYTARNLVTVCGLDLGFFTIWTFPCCSLGFLREECLSWTQVPKFKGECSRWNYAKIISVSSQASQLHRMLWKWNMVLQFRCFYFISELSTEAMCEQNNNKFWHENFA